MVGLPHGAAMWALARSGVCFRTLTNNDGSPERWKPPRLPAWEVPKRNPHERRPRAPDWEPRASGAEMLSWQRSGTMPQAVTSPHRGHHRCQQYYYFAY